MIEFVYGAKGSGKTKKMIEMANNELSNSKGTILFINDRDKYRATVDTHIRFINTEEYNIEGSDELYGFICGAIASNYDVEIIYVDNLLRIIDANGPESTKDILEKLETLLKSVSVKFVLSISAEENDVPEFMKKVQ